MIGYPKSHCFLNHSRAWQYKTVWWYLQ